MKLHPLPGVVVEKTADTLLFLDATSGEVTSVPNTGLTLKATPSMHIIVTSTGYQTARALVDKGLAVAESADSGWMPSRRSVVAGSAVAVGAGLASIALPTIAAASSGAEALETRSALYYWDSNPPTAFQVYAIVLKSVFPEIDEDSFDYANAPAPGEWSVELFVSGATLVLDEPYWNGSEARPGWWWTDRNAPQTSGAIFDGLVGLYNLTPTARGIGGRLLRNGVPVVNLSLTYGQI